MQFGLTYAGGEISERLAKQQRVQRSGEQLHLQTGRTHRDHRAKVRSDSNVQIVEGGQQRDRLQVGEQAA